MLDNDIKSFIEQDYPVLLEAIVSHDLEKVKKWFSDLALKNLTWQALEQKLLKHFNIEKFSTSILIESVVAGDIEIFLYLVKEQGMSVVGKQKSLLSNAILFDREAIVDALILNLEMDVLLFAAKTAEQRDRQNIFKKILLKVHNTYLAEEFSLESYQRMLFNINGVDRNKIPLSYLETAELVIKTFCSIQESCAVSLAKLNRILSQCQHEKLFNLAATFSGILAKMLSHFKKSKTFSYYYSAYLKAIYHDLKEISEPELEKYKELADLIHTLHIEMLMDNISEKVDQAVEKERRKILKNEASALHQLFQVECGELCQLIKDRNLPAIKDFFQRWHKNGVTCFDLDLKIRRLFPSIESFSNLLLQHLLCFWDKEIFEFLVVEAKILSSELELNLISALFLHQESAALYFLEKKSYALDEMVAFLDNALSRNATQVVDFIKKSLSERYQMDASMINRIEIEAIRLAKHMGLVQSTLSYNQNAILIPLRDLVLAMKQVMGKEACYASMMPEIDNLLSLFQKHIKKIAQEKDPSLKLKPLTLSENIQFYFLPYHILFRLKAIGKEVPRDSSRFRMLEAMIEKIIRGYFLYPSSLMPDMPAALKTDVYRNSQEDSVDSLSNEELGLLDEVKKRYAQKYEAIGEKAILDNLRSYLEENIQLQGLSLEYSQDFTQDDLKKYYASIYHTAWRYLFCKPNPWMSKKPQYVHAEAIMVSEDMTTLAYFWLAASDETVACTNGMTYQTRKDHFIREFSLFGRAHNMHRINEDDLKSPVVDDLDGDRPSCPFGVPKRNCQLLFGHPLLDEIKQLSPDIILTLFRENLIACNQNRNSLFDLLQEHSYFQLRELKEAISEWLVELEDTSFTSKQKMASLRLEASEFISDCIGLYGEKRLHCEVIYQNRQINNYFTFMTRLAEEPLAYFADLIVEKIDNLLIAKRTLWHQFIENLENTAKWVMSQFRRQPSYVFLENQGSEFWHSLCAHLVPPDEIKQDEEEVFLYPERLSWSVKVLEPSFAREEGKPAITESLKLKA